MMAPATASEALADKAVAIQAEEVTVAYPVPSGQQVRALDNVTVTVRAARFTVLVGPSGSGKSTLLHVFGGLQRPTQGRIAVCGRRLDGLSSVQLAEFRLATVGFVFQSFHLLPYLQAWENVALPLVAARAQPGERRARALQVLADLGLADRAGHRPGQLSGGEQQRVAIARAVVNNPAVILADEPTGNLDEESARLVLDALASLVRGGTTVVCATHDAAIAELAGDAVHLSHGRLAPAGSA